MGETLAGSAPKISRQFKMRLDALDAERTVRALVMVEAGNGEPPRTARRQGGPVRRAAVIAGMKEAAESHLPAIDRILRRHHGRRLSSHVDALGCIPVEVTPAGIEALAGSEHVRAIFEDQAITRIK
jgi:hypothetical protein